MENVCQNVNSDQLESQDMAKGSKYEAKLLNIFPKEVWSLILVEIKQAKDYHNISSVSLLFRTLLKPRAAHILIPNVVKVLLKQKQLPVILKTKMGSEPFAWEEDTCGLYLLALRQICRGTRKTLDEWLQTQDFRSKSEKYEIETLWLVPFKMGFKAIFDNFQVGEQFVRFAQHFDSTHLTQQANPFLSRGIILKIPSYQSVRVEPYYNPCVRFLQKYGRHLWYCRIQPNFARPQSEFGLYSRRLLSMLRLMPNLKVLHVHGDYYDDEQSGYTEPGHNVIRLPRLEQLNTVSVRGLPFVLVKGLIQNNPQVQQVETQGSAHLAKLCLETLPELTAAAFMLDCREQNGFEILESAQVAGRVERFWLGVPSSQEVKWERVLREVESKFSGSLKELQLRLPEIKENETANIAQGLTLPNLKRLELLIYDPEPMDFLLPLKDTLEVLYIDFYRVGKYFTKEPEEEYMFWFLGKPIKDTIWNHFPNLKYLETRNYAKFSMVGHTCTRDDWEANRQAQNNK